MKIKLFDPHVEKAEENAVKKVLHSKILFKLINTKILFIYFYKI